MEGGLRNEFPQAAGVFCDVAAVNHYDAIGSTVTVSE